MRRLAAPQNSSSVSSAGVLAGNWGQGAHRFAQVGSLLGRGAVGRLEGGCGSRAGGPTIQAWRLLQPCCAVPAGEGAVGRVRGAGERLADVRAVMASDSH